VSDDVKHPDPQDDDFEAHGLKEGVAVALGAGALAVAGTAQSFVRPAEDDGERVVTTLSADHAQGEQTQATNATELQAQDDSGAGGFTSPKKPLRMPES
jgi:hypothetical protein